MMYSMCIYIYKELLLRTLVWKLPLILIKRTLNEFMTNNNQKEVPQLINGCSWHWCKCVMKSKHSYLLLPQCLAHSLHGWSSYIINGY